MSRRGIADFVFLLDGTGTMYPCIEALKENIEAFINELENNPQLPLRDWRSKIVVYRDYNFDGSLWFEDNPFVSCPQQLRDQLHRVDPHGGMDIPESLLDALHKLVCAPQSERRATPQPHAWRHRKDATRMVIVFTDAPFHEKMSYPEGASGTLDDVINVLMAEKINLFLHAPFLEQYEILAETNRCIYTPIEEPFDDTLKELARDKDAFYQMMKMLVQSLSKSVDVVAL